MNGNEILRDRYGERIGEIQMNGSKCTLRDKYGNPIGKGNLLVSLLR